MGSQEPQPQTLDLFEFAQLDEFLITEERITAKLQAFQFLELSQQPDRFDGHAVARMIDVQIGQIIARIRTATGVREPGPLAGESVRVLCPEQKRLRRARILARPSWFHCVSSRPLAIHWLSIGKKSGGTPTVMFWETQTRSAASLCVNHHGIISCMNSGSRS
jgi:hypothetical protein